MKDKDIMNDYLSMVNGSLSQYAAMISQTDNQELRQTLQQMRNQDEIRQYKLYNIAKEKGFYKPAEPADETNINTVRNEFISEQFINNK